VGRGILTPIQTGSPDRRPLFCVHSVGGEVVAYHEMARLLGPEQPVWGLQSPDPPLEEVVEMAEQYIAALRSVQPRGPYRVAGWSMGGAVAYEIARQLETQGERTEVLAIIDASSPPAWYGEKPMTDTEMLGLFAHAMVVLHDVDVPADLEPPPGAPDGFDLASVTGVDLAGLSLDEALAMSLDLGRKVGLLPPSLELAELRRIFDRFRANRGSLRRYRALPYGGEIHLFRATDQIAHLPPGADPTLGWGELAPGRVRLFDCPGDHYTILREQVGALAEKLRWLLGIADGSGGG
jgi:thioesterase domain-containing protein